MLHVNNSNVISWEEEIPCEETSLSHAKEHLGVKDGEITLLGLKWNKDKDTIGVTFPGSVSQPTKTYQGLVASKARLAKEGLTIPRLELVAGHMAVNLAINVE